MNKTIKIFAFAVGLALFSSCAVSGPLMVTDNPNSKTGESSYRVVFGFILDGGDASIKSAAEDGDITRISTVDTRIESGFFTTRIITVVTGE